MNPRKDLLQMTDLTKQKFLNLNYTRVWDENADDIARNSTGITARVFLYVMPIMRLANGYLERNGEQIRSSEISRKMGVEMKDVGAALKELHKKLKIFKRREDGAYYHERLVELFKLKKTDDNGDNSSQSVVNGSNPPQSADNEHSESEVSSRENQQTKVPKNRNKNTLQQDERSESSCNNINDIGSCVKNIGIDIAEPRAADADGSFVNIGFVDIGDCLKVPGAKISKLITKTWLANTKAKPEFESIKDRFEQVVFDCVNWWTAERPGAEIMHGAIIRSLNTAIGKPLAA